MTKKSDTPSKADLTKDYVAAVNTVIEGKPVFEGLGVPVKGINEERLQAYLDAGLLVEADSDNDAAAPNAKLDEAAAKIDTSNDLKV